MAYIRQPALALALARGVLNHAVEREPDHCAIENMNSDAMLDDQAWLKRAIQLSRDSRASGHHPFAAMVVDAAGVVLAQAGNASSIDRTCHAEMVALREASARYPESRLQGASLYSSAEPCAMCAAGAYWVGLGRVVYALSEARLLSLTGNDPENPTLSLPCRQVFAAGQRAVDVIGPLLEDEAAAVHAGFWNPASTDAAGNE